MKHILMDIGSGDDGDIFGKDLFMTDAPDNVLEFASQHVTCMVHGSCAQEHFCEYVMSCGYKIEPVACLDDIPMYVASNDNF